jgi:glycosyltransferase involved in cell wall biosynthesis
MRIVQLTNDNREIRKKYDLHEPVFGPAPEALLEGFKALGDEVEVHVVSCLQQMPRRSPKKLADNIFYHPLHVPKIGWLRTGYQGCIRATRRAIRGLQPDIVHGQGTERDCAMCAVFAGFPNVLTIHGNMQRVAEFMDAKPLTYYWFASKLERLCLKRTDGIVAISAYTQRNVAPYTGCSWLVPNAVHPSFFDLLREPATSLRILCPANIAAHKNQIGLIKALDPLAKEQCFRLLFAGSGGEEDPYFREFIQAIAYRPWCEYLGSLSAVELKKQMSSAYMGILPSFEDNCPMVILEAAAARLPFAASKVGGIPDLIADRKSGMLLNPRDPGSIRECVKSMLEEPELVGRMSSVAYEHAIRRFAADVVARQHVRIYRDVLQRTATKAITL